MTQPPETIVNLESFTLRDVEIAMSELLDFVEKNNKAADDVIEILTKMDCCPKELADNVAETINRSTKYAAVKTDDDLYITERHNFRLWEKATLTFPQKSNQS